MHFSRKTWIAAIPVLLVAALAFPLAALGGDGLSYTTGHTQKIRGISSSSQEGMAATIARLAYPGGVASRTAVILDKSQDSSETGLCALALAGALDAPVLYSDSSKAPSATLDAMRRLGVENTVLVGSPDELGDTVREQLVSQGYSVTRVWGASELKTQMAIYRFGLENELWDATTAFVVPESLGEEAVALAPVAFKLKIPVFVVPDGDGLYPNQVTALEGSDIIKFILVGGEGELSADLADRLGSIAGSHAADGKGIVERVWKDAPADAAVAISQWATGHDYLKWSNTAFAGRGHELDALAASVLQGKTASALLLVDDGENAAVFDAMGQTGIANARIVGDDEAVSADTREQIARTLGFYVAELDGYQTRYIPDISHWNLVYDIDELIANSEFAIMKCTQGAGEFGWSIDARYYEWSSAFNAAGLPHWDYTFMEYGDGSIDYAIAQAQFLMDCSDGAAGYVLDVEDYAGARPTAAQVEAAARHIVASGNKCLIYYSRAYADEYGWIAQLDDLRGSCANWCAAYGVNDGTVSTYASVPSDLHQFTSVGSMPGVWGNCDLSVYLGMEKPLSWFTER
ncbi:MAG: hypothetical protein ACOYIP_07225 [Coriobacteriales bacterium]|jgi:GH25 family lysozyme M1 (1,4-beta-N-acetylmuramidase)